jgi:Holliday junction resolvase RusA-like endonuclease
VAEGQIEEFTGQVYTYEMTGRPVPASRIRVARGGANRFYQGDYAKWRELVEITARNTMALNGWRMFPKGLELSVLMDIRYPNRRFADLDNLFKGSTDKAQRIVFYDDRYISSTSIVRSVCPENPGVTVRVLPAQDEYISTMPLGAERTAKLKQAAKQSGLTEHEIIQRALDQYLEAE